MAKRKVSKWMGVMAVDPGPTTGVVCGVVPPNGEMAARVSRMKVRFAADLGPKGKDVALYRDLLGSGSGLEESHMKMAYCLSILWINFAEKCLEAGINASLCIEDYIGGGGVDRLGGGRTGRASFDPTAFENVRIVASLEMLLWYGLFQGGLDIMRELPHAKSGELLQELGTRVDVAESAALFKQLTDGGMAWLFQPFRQLPSDMSVVKDERLKRWGLWEPGRKHSRDAWRHWVVRLRKMAK